MAIGYDYLEKIGKEFTVTGTYKTLPNSRYRPKTDCILLPKIYVNIGYTFAATGSADGKVRIRMVREDPIDETFYFDVDLLRGYTQKLDTKTEMKRWAKADLGRYVHFEIKSYGVKTCTLSSSTYVSFGEVH